MKIDRGSAARPRPDLLFRELGGETVLLDLEEGTYFGLNEVGTSIWRALQTESGDPRPLEEVHAEVLEEYEVTPDVLWSDLLELMGELAERGLVIVVR